MPRPACPIRSRRLSSVAAVGLLLLDGRAWHGAIGAEDAAIAMLGLEPRPTAGAFVEIDAGIDRHGLDGDCATARACQHRLQDHGHIGGSIQKVRASSPRAVTTTTMVARSSAGCAQAAPGVQARIRRCRHMRMLAAPREITAP